MDSIEVTPTSSTSLLLPLAIGDVEPSVETHALKVLLIELLTAVLNNFFHFYELKFNVKKTVIL